MLTDADREQLVLDHLFMPKLWAQRIHRRIGRRIPFDDLYQYGVIGLIHASRLFEPERGLLFKTLANHKVYGGILDGIRHETHWRNGDPPAPEFRAVTERDAVTDGAVSAIEASRCIDQLRATLPGHQQRGFRLLVANKMHERSLREIARDEQLSPERVGQVAHAALRALRSAA